jgi:hypothetical protein
MQSYFGRFLTEQLFYPDTSGWTSHQEEDISVVRLLLGLSDIQVQARFSRKSNVEFYYVGQKMSRETDPWRV